MDYEELKRRLAQGEEVICPKCEYYNPTSEDCDIISCEDPFKGPSNESVEGHIRDIVRHFNSFYIKEEKK